MTRGLHIRKSCTSDAPHSPFQLQGAEFISCRAGVFQGPELSLVVEMLTLLSRTLSGPRESLALSETPLSSQSKERLVQTHAQSGFCLRCLREGPAQLGTEERRQAGQRPTVTASPHVVLLASGDFNQQDSKLLTLMIES